MHLRRLARALTATAALTAAAVTSLGWGESPEPTTPQLGMNITSVVYWSGDWPFVDLMKSASDWRIQGDGGDWTRADQSELIQDGTLVFTEDGYVKPAEGTWDAGDFGVQSIRTILPGGNEAADPDQRKRFYELPTGDYTLTASGTGKLRITGGGFQDTTLELSGVPRTVRVPRSAGTVGDGIEQFGLLSILATSAEDPVRDIRFIMPGFEDTADSQPFHPLFLERLRPFKGLRMMDWGHTNQTHVSTWDQRPTPNLFSYSMISRFVPEGEAGGVPLEVQVQLANAVEADLWICLPAKADADYALKAVELCLAQLDPELNLVVEYANEVFNRAFLANKLAYAEGQKRFPDEKRWTQQGRVLAERFAELYQPIDAAYSGEQRERIDLVVPYQFLWFYKRQEGAPHPDAVIANSYWGIEFTQNLAKQPDVSKLTDVQVLERMEEEVMPELRRKLEKTVEQLHDAYPDDTPPLWIYEGGSHFHDIWWNKQVADATGAVTSRLRHHPRVGELVGEMIDLCGEMGMPWVYLFASTGGGFGHLEHPSQDPRDAPKYQAAIRRILDAADSAAIDEPG